MTARTRNTIIAVAVGVVVLIIGIKQARKGAGKSREVRATITYLDAPARKASAEVIDPETGGAMEISGEVPAECEITINGRPAKLEDLSVKDQAVIRGRVENDTPSSDGKSRKKVVPISIHVTRKSDAPAESKPIPIKVDGPTDK